MKKLLTLTIGLVLLALPSFAQQVAPGTTPVQQVQPLYACDVTATATGLASATTTATSGTNGSKTFYICHIDIVEAANALVTVGAGPNPTCTTTNLVTNLTWWGDNSALTQGSMRPIVTIAYGAVPLKSLTPGTAFTIACSGGQATQNVRINFSGFFN
jgi:hypothetical protein